MTAFFDCFAGFVCVFLSGNLVCAQWPPVSTRFGVRVELFGIPMPMLVHRLRCCLKCVGQARYWFSENGANSEFRLVWRSGAVAQWHHWHVQVATNGRVERHRQRDAERVLCLVLDSWSRTAVVWWLATEIQASPTTEPRAASSELCAAQAARKAVSALEAGARRRGAGPAGPPGGPGLGTPGSPAAPGGLVTLVVGAAQLRGRATSQRSQRRNGHAHRGPRKLPASPALPLQPRPPPGVSRCAARRNVSSLNSRARPSSGPPAPPRPCRGSEATAEPQAHTAPAGAMWAPSAVPCRTRAGEGLVRVARRARSPGLAASGAPAGAPRTLRGGRTAPSSPPHARARAEPQKRP